MTDPITTTYRLAVAAVVETATGIDVKPGKFDGPVRNGKLGCCWPFGVREDSSNVTRQVMEVRVRLFLDSQERSADPEIPLDPAPLELLISQCQAALSPSGEGATPTAGIWFARLTDAEVNMDLYGIEFAVVAVGWNEFVLV